MKASRVVQILTTLQAGKSYAVSDLAKIFGTSRRMIFRDPKELQSLSVPYHKEVEILDKCFIEGDDFDLYEYLGRAWSMIPEGRIYNIKLRFLPKVADNVTEVQWHSPQKATHNSGGSVTMEFRVDGLGEIIWWILGYGDQVQVLRNRVVEMAKNIVKLNEPR